MLRWPTELAMSPTASPGAHESQGPLDVALPQESYRWVGWGHGESPQRRQVLEAMGTETGPWQGRQAEPRQPEEHTGIGGGGSAPEPDPFSPPHFLPPPSYPVHLTWTVAPAPALVPNCPHSNQKDPAMSLVPSHHSFAQSL